MDKIKYLGSFSGPGYGSLDQAFMDGFTSLADGMWSMKSRQNVGWNDVREYREDPYGVYLHKVDAYVSFPALTGEEIIDLYHALPEEEGYILGEWAYRITVGPRGGVRAVKA